MPPKKQPIINIHCIVLRPEGAIYFSPAATPRVMMDHVQKSALKGQVSVIIKMLPGL